MKIVSANVTGSFILNGVDVTNILGSSSLWSGSFSTRTSNLELFSGSINSYTASNNTNISNINATTASLNSYTGSNNTNIGNINATTASLNTFSGSASSRLSSLEVTSGSNITRLSSIESTTGSLNAASGSAITRLNALEVTSGSNITRISALESASGSAISRLNSIESTTGSLNAASGSAITRLSALEVTSGSNISRLSSLESKTGSYATTGSNTFVDSQYISASNNAIGFTSTSSLYTDGGLRVAKDAYISGTLYLNNVTVYGTQSVCFITSSQLNIASNIISVNTATPSVRFGGLSVYDSGSTGLTGSLLWDSEDNQWIYSNPSGSTYDSAMFLVGPRNSGVLGNEPGISCNFLSKGNGLHHMTSSGIFENGTTTCFYGNTVVSSSGTVCTTMANASCIGINTTTPFKRLTIDASDVASDGIAVRGNSSPAYIICETSGVGSTFTNDSAAGYIGTITNHPFNVRSNSQNRLTFSSAGVACFACQVCTPSLTTTSVLCSTGGTNYFGNAILAYAPACDSILGGSILISGGYSVIRGGTDRSFNVDNYINSTTCVNALKIFNSGIACFGCTTCAPTLVAGSGGIRTSNNIIFPGNLTTRTIWNEGYGGAVQLRRSDADTDRYARIGIVDAVGNWVSGMTIDGGTAWGKFDAGICTAQAICAPAFVGGTITAISATSNAGSPNALIAYSGNDCSTIWRGAISLQHNADVTISAGSSIGITLNPLSSTGSSFYGSAAIKAVRENATSNNQDTALAFWTRAGASNSTTDTEKVRITSDGYLAVTGNQSLKCVPYLQGMSFGWNRSNGQGESMINWTNQGGGISCDLTFNFRNSTTLFERMRITAAGNLGIGTDTPNYTLQVNGTSCFAGNVAIGGSYCAFALNVHGVTYQIGGSTWVQNGYGYVNSGATTTGLFPLSDNTIQLRINNSSALTINSAGVSCFISTVCAPGIIVGTSQENTTLSSSRIHLNTCIQRFYTINHWSLANGSFSCTVTDSAATYGCAKAMPLNGSSTYFFGPYSYLTPGSYVAKFRMKVVNNSCTTTLFYLDTNRGAGVNVSANTFCTSGCYQYISLPFTISSPSDVFEARALNYNSGITCTYLDHVLIEAAENPGQYFSKDNFSLYTGHFNCARLNIDTNGNTIFNCNGTYCSNFGYNFLTACNGSILSGTHTMGNVGAGTTCATPYWCNGGALRMEFNWSTGGYINWTNHNNCTPFLLNYSTNYITKHCFDYAGNACHSGIVIANGYQGAAFSSLSAGGGTGVASFDTITRSGVGLYEVAITANPNAGGSDYYDFWYGHRIVGRGYSGTAVTDYIAWCQESPPPRCLYPSGGGGLVVTACMFQSGVESTCIGRDGSYTIRFKIAGYNSSYTGANTTIYLKSII